MSHEQGTTLQYATPMVRPKVPIALAVVAVLFILGGVSATLEVITALLRGGIDLNFGVLGLFIGPGLLRFRRGWRTCGLVFTWFGLICLPLIAIFFMMSSRPLDFTVFGSKVGTISNLVGALGCLALFALTVWQYRVLTRPDVRRLFGLR